MSMQLYCDRSGWPWVRLSLDLACSLLPITKMQFELYLAEPGPPGPAWYEELLQVNPRCPARHFRDSEREHLFLTGITPEEALAFGNWLDPGTDLPTWEEWRFIYQALATTNKRLPITKSFEKLSLAPTARSVIDGLQSISRLMTLGQIGLAQEGVLEWVRHNREFGGCGKPRPNFWATTANPLKDTPQRPVVANARHKACGFRLVTRIQAKGQEI